MRGRRVGCITGNQNLSTLVEVYAAVLELVLITETLKLVCHPDDQGDGGKVGVGNHVCKSAFISLRVSAYARMCGRIVSWTSNQTDWTRSERGIPYRSIWVGPD